jgi:cell division protein FtsZ
VISSTGQINVDFADVCTVMRNGGKAILGNGVAAGENRAQVAIEEAMNSPLLNDNDIRGARWILINITSAEGDHEYTMDEVEVIQNYVLTQAGEDTDVILGIGYDAGLGDKIGITLIATGFEADKIVETGENKERQAQPEKLVLPLEANQVSATPVVQAVPENVETVAPADKLAVYLTPEIPSFQYQPDKASATVKDDAPSTEPVSEPASVPSGQIVSGGYLTPPIQIYEEENVSDSVHNEMPNTEEAYAQAPVIQFIKEEDDIFNMQLVEKEAEPVDETTSGQLFPAHMAAPLGVLDEEDLQRRKAAERLQKLRNLSYNIYGNDVNNEFDSVPAYVRRNLELYSTISPAENFYSNYTVKADENNQTHLSNLNSFLEGNKPD